MRFARDRSCARASTVTKERTRLLDVRRVFNPQNTGAFYAGVTAVLILAVAVSQWCFRWQNTTGLTYMALRDVCLAVWAVSGILLAVSQVAFVVLALRRKHYGFFCGRAASC